MKKSKLILILLALNSIFLWSCNKADDDNNDDNNGTPTIPDAVFSMNVSGAENHQFDFTLPGNVAGTNAINGSHLSSQQLLTMLATTLPVSWQYSIIADVNSVENGTYDLKVGMSSFASPSQTTGYLATSGTMSISKATLYQNASSIEDWFIDGTFSGIYMDNETPPNQITISGSFSGVNIKAQ